jgi:hypothetical protein
MTTEQFVRRITRPHFLREQDEDLPEEEPIDVQAAASSGSSAADAQMNDAFKAMVMGVLDDRKLDLAGKMARIKEILRAQEKLLAKSDGDMSESQRFLERVLSRR